MLVIVMFYIRLTIRFLQESFKLWHRIHISTSTEGAKNMQKSAKQLAQSHSALRYIHLNMASLSIA